jgi:hypothetical protein
MIGHRASLPLLPAGDSERAAAEITAQADADA